MRVADIGGEELDVAPAGGVAGVGNKRRHYIGAARSGERDRVGLWREADRSIRVVARCCRAARRPRCASAGIRRREYRDPCRPDRTPHDAAFRALGRRPSSRVRHQSSDPRWRTVRCRSRQRDSPEEHRRLATWSVRSVGLPPALGRKMLQLGKVGLVGIVVRRGLPGQIEHVPDKHRAYGMNGVMPIKPFVH